MTIDIPNQIIGGYLGGVIAILAVVGLGALLFYILKIFAEAFPFTRLGIVLALSPLSLFFLTDDRVRAALFIYAMITTLIGIIIDGTNHMLPGRKPQAYPGQSKHDGETDESDPDGLVWEKAE